MKDFPFRKAPATETIAICKTDVDSWVLPFKTLTLHRNSTRSKGLLIQWSHRLVVLLGVIQHFVQLVVVKFVFVSFLYIYFLYNLHRFAFQP